VSRLAGAVVVACLGLVALATPASAHNTLIGSTPKDKATVDTGPSTIELTFDQPVQAGQDLNSIAVIGPDNDHWEAGPVQVASNVARTPVRPLGPAGVYRIGYRILSADGHPVSGELTFTLTRPGTGSPLPADQLPRSADSTSGADEGVPVWVWLAGAAALLGAGLVLAFRMGGKSPP
jgi:methionine-rich copper-binding protein CopC